MANAVDACVAQFPPETQGVLQSVRATLVGALPGATEMIRYQIPAYRMTGSFVI
jgi:uncharacterized protein YdhG (YjbR/CyaY superfamily)